QEIRAGYGRRPLPEGCSPALRAILARLLAANPVDRYASAAAVLADLDRVSSGLDPEALTFAFHAAVDDAPTRRTRPAGVDPDATRRTEKPHASTPAASVRVAHPAPLTAPRKSRRL